MATSKYPPRILLIVILLSSWTTFARESKQQRKLNALAVRKILTYLPRISDSYALGKPMADTQQELKKTEEYYHTIQAKIPPHKNKEYTQTLSNIAGLIKKKSELLSLDREIKALSADIRHVFQINEAPAQVPDYILGADVYKARCALCHGHEGHAESALAKRLKPPPPPLKDSLLQDRLTPFRTYNVMITGVDNGSMQPFDAHLSDHELWSIAFYINSFNCPPGKSTANEQVKHITMKEISTSNSADLREKHLNIDACALKNSVFGTKILRK